MPVRPLPSRGARVALGCRGLSLVTYDRTPVRCRHRPCAVRHGTQSEPRERSLCLSLPPPHRGSSFMHQAERCLPPQPGMLVRVPGGGLWPNLTSTPLGRPRLRPRLSETL